MPPQSVSVGDRPTVDAPSPDGPLPSGGALEVRRLRDAIEASLFDRARDIVRIGRFTVLDRLGAGGMGVVYAAYDPGLNRKVAVKVLRHEDGNRESLVDEARAMARLSHPCIVTVHEVGEHEGQVFVAMESIDGESLDQWIIDDGEVRPWREVVAVFDQAGRGLAAAHAAGLVHRDFKPHNVMIANDGAVKVLDFGLARAIRHDTDDRSLGATGPHGKVSGASTMTGALSGTPAYMSPEQFGAQRATPVSDQFSFCVALFEALHGQRPFEGDTLEELACAVVEGRQRPPPAASRVPNFLRDVLAKGMSVDPDARFGSMDALLAALRRDPAARRRRAGATLGVAVIAAGGGLLWPSASHSEDPCIDAGAALDVAWDDSRRAATRDGLLASGSPRAMATWTAIAPQLDAYTDAWRASAHDACRAHVARHESSLTFDRRTACLRTRRASLAAATALLADADLEVVDRGMAVVAALPSIPSCGAGETPTPAFVLPQLPEVADAVAKQRDQLARARVLEEAGQYAKAQTIARAVQDSAAKLTFAPLRAEAAVVLGSIAMYVEPPEVAEETLSRAVVLAVESGHDPVAIEAVAKRAFVRGELLRAPSTAHDDERHVQALLSRHQTADAHLQWLVANNLGVVRERSDDEQGATQYYERALRHARRRADAGRLDAVATLTNLAYAANGRGDAQLAEAHATEAVALAEAALGSEHPQLPLPLHALGEALVAQSRDDTARPVLLRALAIAESSGEALPPTVIADLQALCELAQRQGQHEAARTWCARAVALAQSTLGPKHPLTTEVLSRADTVLGPASGSAADQR